MKMDRLAYFCDAATGNRRKAAQAFLGEASEESAVRVLDAAMWRDEDVKDFEGRGLVVCIQGEWGRFWLASPSVKKILLPPAPRLAPSGLVALARGLVDVLAN